MENTVDQIGEFKVFDSPEALSASMNAEPQQTETTTEEAPQQEPQPVQENVQAEPQVETTFEPAEQTPHEDIQQQTADTPIQQPEYTETELQGAVFSYLSEKLGRDISSLDALSSPQQTALDERIEAIANFVEDTGRSPEDWFAYQQLNPSEMDDATAVRVNMAAEYPSLSREELNLLVDSKYKLDVDLFSEDEIKLSRLQLKIDAEKAKESIEGMRSDYRLPAHQETSSESPINDKWISDMKQEVTAMTGLEFNLGNDKTFSFGLDEAYKSQLIEKNTQLDNYFDPYIRQDGSWDYDTLSSHRAVIDNIDKIVSSAYRQGTSDGQRGIVEKAANVSTSSPQSAPQNENPLAEQLGNILRGNSSKLTFKI
tara:strand:+ start:15155 stop:16264 length:1110 start_codon:yes stop_codon:yes gene_type:complete